MVLLYRLPVLVDESNSAWDTIARRVRSLSRSPFRRRFQGHCLGNRSPLEILIDMKQNASRKIGEVFVEVIIPFNVLLLHRPL
jgi:hypothetical protein